MLAVWVRFYGELNDFMRSERRGRRFAHRLRAPASVKDTIEAATEDEAQQQIRKMGYFVTKLNAPGSAPAYSTYLGGGGEDDGRGIAVDAVGSIYVTGQTASTDFPTTAGAAQTGLERDRMIYLQRINRLLKGCDVFIIVTARFGCKGDHDETIFRHDSIHANMRVSFIVSITFCYYVDAVNRIHFGIGVCFYTAMLIRCVFFYLFV